MKFRPLARLSCWIYGHGWSQPYLTAWGVPSILCRHCYKREDYLGSRSPHFDLEWSDNATH